MDVVLSPELEQLVQTKVASGEYGSVSEVVSEALRMMDEMDRTRERQLNGLRARLDRSLAHADRGEVVDGEEFMQRMLDDLDGRYAREVR